MRIIAGEWRGRRLIAPAGTTVRPTLGRVRQAIFDLPLVRPRDATVLDLYAGSGALGIEALSRGARRVVFVERDRQALEAIRRNLAPLSLEAGRAEVLGLPAERALAGCSEAFDLLLADPPYRLGLGVALLQGMTRWPGLLSPGGVLLLQAEPGAVPGEGYGALGCVFRRTWGETEVTIWREA
jgi:16S rRNA (guanine(966)-N(2))-methyltransferase RsmD